jgi:hypothetical protein
MNLASTRDGTDLGANLLTPRKSPKFIYPAELDLPLATRRERLTSFVLVAKRIC